MVSVVPAEAPAEIVEEVVQTRTVSFLGPEFGTAVFVDGRLVGTSPEATAKLSYGTHDVLMRSAQYGELRRQIEVGESTAGTYRWRSGTDYLTATNQ